MVPRKYLDELSSRLETAFGRSSLRAVYITGSAAVGAYREGTSDLDVLVAVEAADRAALERVVATCAHSALPCPASKLELVVYEVSELRAPHVPPRWSLNFDTGEGVHQVDFDPGSQPSHWFVLDLAFAHRHAVPMVGSAEIGDPGDASIGRAFDEMVEWYEKHEPAGADVAHARAEHWRKTGRFAPKPGLPST
jgi:Nucleotidyltransferase domain